MLCLQFENETRPSFPLGKLGTFAISLFSSYPCFCGEHYTNGLTNTWLFSFFSVAYRINELYYVWSRPDNAVSYEGKLELSQFDIMETAYRSLNYSRGYNSKSFIHIRGRTQGGNGNNYTPGF